VAGRVLIVDDDPEIVAGLRHVLERESVTVDGAADAADAIALIGQHQYCGLVLDLVLRNSSGFDVLHHIAQHKVSLPTIVVTGKLPSYVREMLNAQHVKLVFPKPVDPRLLATIVVGLCGSAA
jgi:two-component system, NtrC family, response regulator PilR